MAHTSQHVDHHGRHHVAKSRVAKAMRSHGGAGHKKVEKVLHEFGAGELHSGSKHGPTVHDRRQAIAIALSEGRKAAHGHSKHRGKPHHRARHK